MARSPVVIPQFSASPSNQRKLRTPQHRFTLRQKPWQIQPMLIAPVLPGETMRNLLLQSRVVSKPVRSPLVGWWLEYYFFYVKLRDFTPIDPNLATDIEKMVLDPSYDIKTDHNVAGAVARNYKYANTIDWVELCLQRVCEEYFRNENDSVAYNDASRLIDGVPASRINIDNFMQSFQNDADRIDPDVLVDTGDNSSAGDPHHHAVSAAEMNEALKNYQWARLNNLTEMSFEEYVRTYGVRIAEPTDYVPELLRYIRDWQYPSNTVEPSTGTPSIALSWSVAERADKDRFFREPGFIFGVSCVRPKVYLGKQDGAAVGLLTNAVSWLPALMAGDPFTSIVHVDKTKGPLSAITDNGGYWLDIRDLFLYGDQFSNVALSAANELGAVDLPTAAGDRDYATDAMALSLFKNRGQTEGEVTYPTLDYFLADGVVSLNISGTQVDYTRETP